MYVRTPNTNRQNIKVPENYSGNAFTQTPKLHQMPPPVRQSPPRHDLPPEDITESKFPEPYITDELEAGEEQEAEVKSTRESPPEIKRDEKLLMPASAGRSKEGRSSIFSSLLPPGIDFSSHFPFGHGIGSEEIIILAVMLLVYLSSSDDAECDHELILLLGLLLLAG